MSIADWVYLMADSKIIAAERLRSCTTMTTRVQQFLQGEADGPVPFRFPAQSLEKDLF